MRVRVYWNFRRKAYSVQTWVDGKGWRVQYHTPILRLTDVSFIVKQAGRLRVLREGRKNVHAFVEGELRYAPFNLAEAFSVTYNPYRHEQFTNVLFNFVVVQAAVVDLSVADDDDGRKPVVLVNLDSGRDFDVVYSQPQLPNMEGS